MNNKIVRNIITKLAGFGIVFILVACSAPKTSTVAPTSAPTTVSISPTSAPTTISPTTEPTTVQATSLPTAEPTTAQGVPATDVLNLVNGKFNTVDRSLALWNIQPGLGTVMIEYGNRLARLWFAANAGNWDMAKYQLDEMIEIQEVGETTRPNRADMLKGFEDSSLTALGAAIDAQDQATFAKAFDDTVAGCNACHTVSTGDNWSSFQFVHVQVPKIDPAFYIDWAGGGQGNYIANPTPGATTEPTAAPTGSLDAAGVEQLVNSIFNNVDRSLALWNIQPGLGTVMMEYGNRFSRMYFAAKAGNWDMARYQLDEMVEIQEVGETTRPKRADMLKAFEENSLAPLSAAIDAQDVQAFDTAYSATADGCNACHTASSGTDWKSYQFIKIQVPTADNNDYIAWAADKLTGSYIANPPPSATATSVPPLTGTLDLPGVEELVNAKFNNVDRSLALWNIQPGLGTVMIEYGRRLAQLVYAIQAGNWDMAKYQLDEALEIQEVGETTRPNRAPMLKAFEEGSLSALNDAIMAQDTDKSNTAVTNVINGCNACHTGSQGSHWSSYGFIKIQQPLTDPADYLQWNTEGGTGNYKP